jgi:hypothetical protein
MYSLFFCATWNGHSSRNANLWLAFFSRSFLSLARLLRFAQSAAQELVSLEVLGTATAPTTRAADPCGAFILLLLPCTARAEQSDRDIILQMQKSLGIATALMCTLCSLLLLHDATLMLIRPHRFQKSPFRTRGQVIFIINTILATFAIEHKSVKKRENLGTEIQSYTKGWLRQRLFFFRHVRIQGWFRMQVIDRRRYTVAWKFGYPTQKRPSEPP